MKEHAPATAPPESLTADEVYLAFADGPVPVALAVDDAVARVNRPFAEALGRSPEACEGRPLFELVPPEPGEAPRLPEPGARASYRARLDGVRARVDLAA
ncbi:MAG TPA: PAS domain-containing protein, partial [Anaeromyxobacteraceae bacterium]|nr:PAS domain-containing protein [Anaeromyxobacteraceae bacterium]